MYGIHFKIAGWCACCQVGRALPCGFPTPCSVCTSSGTSLDLLFMRFPFLGRCLLPVFVSPLFLLVGVVLLVLLFPVVPSTLFLASCFIVILGSHGPLQVGCQFNWPLRAVSSAFMATILSSSCDLAPHVPSCFNKLNLFVANMISSSCVRVSIPSV
jgi:hypothetical protein